jgi:hypothetical protein
LLHGESRKSENSIEHPFPEGGLVRLRLSSGDYAVRATNGGRIVVRWSANDSDGNKRIEDVNKTKVEVDTSGSVATVRTQGPTTNLRFVIELPQRSDLYLRLRAGDVRIEGIEGNKDIHMTAGDLNIEAHPHLYSLVNASVTFGDLQAKPFLISKDGIGQSFEWHGEGRYALRASLFAGDLNLLQK